MLCLCMFVVYVHVNIYSFDILICPSYFFDTYMHTCSNKRTVAHMHIHTHTNILLNFTKSKTN